MKRSTFFAIFGAGFLSIAGLCLLHLYPGSTQAFAFLAQNTYLGPISPVPGNPKLIQVEVIINDDPKLGGVQIQKVSFNQINIPLKPKDVYGFRGQGSFQLPPGQYKLKWTVNRDKLIWPRTISHEQLVNLDRRDLWVQIIIEGEEASIR